MPRTLQASDCLVESDGSLASILAPPSASDLLRQHTRPAHPSDTRPLKFQIRRLTGLSTQLVALCYFFYLSEQRITPYFNKKTIVFLKVTPVNMLSYSYSCSEKSREKKKPKMFVNVLHKIERTLGISIIQVIAELVFFRFLLFLVLLAELFVLSLLRPSFLSSSSVPSCLAVVTAY